MGLGYLRLAFLASYTFFFLFPFGDSAVNLHSLADQQLKKNEGAWKNKAWSLRRNWCWKLFIPFHQTVISIISVPDKKGECYLQVCLQ